MSSPRFPPPDQPAQESPSSSAQTARRVAGEVCHRAKNDLQTVANLLALAWPFTGSPQELAEAMEGRVGALSVCYNLIAELGSAPTLDQVVQEVLRRLAWRMPGQAQLERRVQPLSVGLRLCSPLALWLHEIITNALEHGLARAGRPKLSVQGAVDAQGLRLSVIDNGPGLPPGFDWNTHVRLGLKLAQAVAMTDLRGTMELVPGAQGGTEARLTVPAHELSNLNRGNWP